jgi:enoyl-CoA hydratase/carnithine racemase
VTSVVPARTLAEGKLLLDEPTDGVARLTISSPSRRNALDGPILDAIDVALTELASPHANARCVLIMGASGLFPAGFHIGEPHDEQDEDLERLMSESYRKVNDRLERFPYPTVAALSGLTIREGFELALACDLRVATNEIELQMSSAKLGCIYPHTGTQRFLRAIGAARTRELFFLGRPVDAPVALRWGLVNRLVPFEDLETVALEITAGLAARRARKLAVGT